MSGARVRVFGRAGLSSLAGGEAQVGDSKFGDEESGILPAFGCPDFDGTFHVTSPVSEVVCCERGSEVPFPVRDPLGTFVFG